MYRTLRINDFLKWMTQTINNYLNQKYGQDSNNTLVVLSGLVGADGQLLPKITKNKNRIAITLLHVEPDGSRGGALIPQKPTDFNIYVLITSYFDSSDTDDEYYDNALKYLNDVMDFFCNYREFNDENTPTLDMHGTTITPHLVKMNFNDLTNVYSSIGAKYLPSVVYQLRGFLVMPEGDEFTTPTINS